MAQSPTYSSSGGAIIPTTSAVYDPKSGLVNTPAAPAPAPIPTPSPYVPDSGVINRSVDPSTNDPASTFLNTFTPPETRDQIAERMRKDAQGQIDAINAEADSAVAQANKSGQERLSADNATSVLSGLMGS